MKLLLNIFALLIASGMIAQPANNLCTGAQSTTADGTCYSGTLTGAADNLTGEAGCATQGGPNNHRDIWYSFTATTSTVEFDITSPSNQTIELLLLSGTCGSLTLVNSTCQTSPLNTTFAGLTVGQTYYYAVSFPNNTQDNITTCVTSVTAPPSAGQNCTTAQPVCSNSSFEGNSDGFGVQELSSSNQGCLLSSERQTSWYYFQIQTGGTLEMTIDPLNNVDYDYALWGPMSSYTCPVSGTPVRCSYASGVTTFINTGSYNTGIGAPGTETSDGTGGALDGWSSTLNVLTGEFYILVIDNFQVDNTPFTLSWGGTSVLSCAILLPVELDNFDVITLTGANQIEWSTRSEKDNDKFTIERSTDAVHFNAIGEVDGAGNSSSVLKYEFLDKQYERSLTNYYRLRQTDFNGAHTYSHIVAAENKSTSVVVDQKVFDLTGRNYNTQTLQPGLYIIVTFYDDGSTETKKVHIQ
jgi:hypothetical protein